MHFYISFVYSRDLLLLDGCGNLVWSKHEEQPSEDARLHWKTDALAVADLLRQPVGR